MSLTVYGVNRSRALRPLWLLKELNQPYEQVGVNWADKSCKGGDYLSINPNAKIPALKDGDLVLFESFAITLYLAKKFPSDLGPKDLAEDAQMTMWSLWAANEIEKACVNLLFISMAPADQRDAGLITKHLGTLAEPLAVLEAHLAAHGGFLVGGRFTVADLNVSSVISWLHGTPQAFEGKPALIAWRDACLKRPAFKAVIKGE